jgi:hypothetical protein
MLAPASNSSPPPLNLSNNFPTFILPSDLALIPILLSSNLPTTNDASILSNCNKVSAILAKSSLL